jgi:hypothetical protein
MGFLTEWPPNPDQYYLQQDSARPFFQGDVFDDVPFVTVRAGDSIDGEPKSNVQRRRVCTLLYPCDMYSPEGTFARVQAVAVVREQGASDRLPDDWAGCFNLCPYPGLGDEGAMLFADFRSTANVDRSYFRTEKRVASLSAVGWAYFRQRIALHYTRGCMRLERLHENGANTWTELELWREWSAEKGRIDGFQKWYNSPSPDLAGFTPNEAANRGMLLDVKEIMCGEMAR